MKIEVWYSEAENGILLLGDIGDLSTEWDKYLVMVEEGFSPLRTMTHPQKYNYVYIGEL